MTESRRGPLSSAGRDVERTVVTLRGEHDIATLGALSENLTRAMAFDQADLVVELSGVEFMGAETVGALIRARQFLRAQSRGLVLRSPSPCAWRVLDICGLGELVDPPQLARGGSGGTSALGTWVAVPTAERTGPPPAPSAAAPEVTGAESVGSTSELVDRQAP